MPLPGEARVPPPLGARRERNPPAAAPSGLRTASLQHGKVDWVVVFVSSAQAGSGCVGSVVGSPRCTVPQTCCIDRNGSDMQVT